MQLSGVARIFPGGGGGGGGTQGPISQRVAINRTMDINRSSMANRVLRKLVINRNPF